MPYALSISRPFNDPHVCRVALYYIQIASLNLGNNLIDISAVKYSIMRKFNLTSHPQSDVRGAAV